MMSEFPDSRIHVFAFQTCPGDKKKRSVDGDGRATTSPIGSTEPGWDEKPVEFDIVLKASLSVFEPYAKGSGR